MSDNREIRRQDDRLLRRTINLLSAGIVISAIGWVFHLGYTANRVEQNEKSISELKQNIALLSTTHERLIRVEVRVEQQTRELNRLTRTLEKFMDIQRNEDF